jgi:hypothetical protein
MSSGDAAGSTARKPPVADGNCGSNQRQIAVLIQVLEEIVQARLRQ